MNATDNYDVYIRDYCRMNLYLVEMDLKMKIPLNIVQQDIEDLVNPLLKKEKIGDKPITNVNIDKEEKLDINHRERRTIKLKKDWIKRPFKLDPIHQIVVFHAQACLAKG